MRRFKPRQTITLWLLAMWCAAPYTPCWPSCHLQVGQELQQAPPIPRTLCHNSCYSICFNLILPLSSSQWKSTDSVDMLATQAETVSQAWLLAGQLCCLPLWAGLELHQTGNLRVALVIQPSHCLIPHKQTPTPPHTRTRTTTTPPPVPSAHNSVQQLLLSLVWQWLAHHTS